MSRRSFVLLLAALAVTGCNTCRRHHFQNNRPACNTCNSPFVPAPVRPRAAVGPIPSPPPRPLPDRPPIARLDVPSPPAEREPSEFRPAPSDDPPPADPLSSNDFAPRTPPATLGAPRSLSPDDRRDVARPYVYEPPAVANVPNKRKAEPAEPKLTNPEIVLNVKPATKGVRSGLVPYPEDFSWLSKQGFRAVLNLRDPGREDPAGKRLAERAGLEYQSLTASPERMDRATYDDFVRAVNDAEAHPLYVYHKDGTVAGGLWYLYYRLHKGESDEDARARAKALGLDFAETNDAHVRMVAAVQRFLRDYRE